MTECLNAVGKRTSLRRCGAAWLAGRRAGVIWSHFGFFEADAEGEGGRVGGVRRKRARSFKEDAEEEEDDDGDDDDDDAAIAGHLSGSTQLLNLVTDERAMATLTVMTG